MAVLMPSPVFRWFVPAQNGTGLVPAEGYKAKFYAAGTATPKTIYELDGDAYPSPSNTAVLNSQGFAGILLGDGAYKLVVTDPDDTPVYTQDNISGSGSFGSGFVETVQPTDPAPAFGPNGLAECPIENKFTWVGGYWAIGDGGHGFFWNEESNDADDGGYIIASTDDPDYRWFRIPDEDSKVRAASFGYIGTLNEDLTDEFTAAESYAGSHNLTLFIAPGDNATIALDDGFDFYAPYIEFAPGAVLTTSGTGDDARIGFAGDIIAPPEPIFSGWTEINIFGYSTVSRPEWFGASNADPDTAVNTTAMNLWLACGSSYYCLPPGAWKYTNISSFPYPTVPMDFLGTVNGGGSGTIPTGVYYPTTSRFRVGEVRFTNNHILESDGVGGIETSGDFTVGDALAVTSNISGGANIIAVSDIEAGQVISAGAQGAGTLRARAGTALKFVPAPGTYASEIGTETATTILSTLFSAPYLADSLVESGQMLRIRARGYMDGDSLLERQVRVRTTSDVIFDITWSINSITGNMEWDLCVDFWYESTGNFYSSGTITMMNIDGAEVYGTTLVNSQSGTFDFTADSTISLQGRSQAGSNSAVVARTFSIEYHPKGL